MVRYTSTDIIKRAEQIADLSNSEFITDYEKIALLNENWTLMYEDVIRSGDEAFVIHDTISDGEELPKDCYRIRDVYCNRVPLFISKTDGYEIVNNVFHLHSINKRSVEINYYPRPKTIYLRDKKQQFPVSTLSAAWEDMYVNGDTVSDTAGNTATVEPGTYTEAIIRKNGIYYDNRKFYDLLRGAIVEIASDVIPYIQDDYIYFYNPSLEQVIDINQNILKNTSYENYPEDTVNYIYSSGNDTYFITDDYYEKEGSETKVNLSERYSNMCIVNGELALITKLNQFVVGDGEDCHIVNTEYLPVSICSTTKVITKKPIENSYWTEGLVEDTVFDFADNIYYVLLSYKLAIAFCVKQAKDTTALTALYTEAYNQFIASIKKDDNSQYTIKNVYSTPRFYL